MAKGRFQSPIKFEDKFDKSDDPTDTRGMNVLSTTGCMQRHDITRDEMMNTEKENKTSNLEYPLIIEKQEQQLCNTVASLLHRGYKLRPEETLEEFVARCLDEQDIETRQRCGLFPK